MPKLFWDTEDGQHPSDVVSSSSSGTVAMEHDVSPEMHAKRILPMAGYVGINASAEKMPEKYEKQLAGRAVTLNERKYGQPVADLFSAVIDAMTSLHVPVASVDSPNGVITSDWIRKGENSINTPNMIGYTRHRFVVRVYRAGAELGHATRLEVHVIGQLYESSKWVDKKLVRNVSEELIVSVEEQLAAMQQRGSAGQ